MSFRQSISLAIIASTFVVASACTDKGKVSEIKAREHVEVLAKLANEDVEQLRRGLPLGAKALGEGLSTEGDEAPEPEFLRQHLDRVRNAERDLAIAKSTFFAVVDTEGKVLRSDQDPDTLVGKSMLTSFPELRRALEGDFVETYGVMRELQGSRSGPDEQRVVGAPIRDDKGEIVGAYVSGWSLERYAYRLEHALRGEVTREAEKESGGKVPLAYAFVFRGEKVYGAPVTPAVNEEALQELNLAAATKDGVVFHDQVVITGRKFGVAAQRVDELGDDSGVAVLRSEI